MNRSGFTLFEVGISTVLIALGILTLALFLPVGIKAQQKARFEIYAATKSLDMVEQFVSQGFNLSLPGGRFQIQLEADEPWNCIAGYKAYTPDLETSITDIRSSIYPLPRVIAERLMSANDEIRHILDAGGNLYYSNPLPTHGIKPDTSYAIRPPSEAQRLVFAITGYPQQNAIPYLPWKAWPYYIPYPSPPMVNMPRERKYGQTRTYDSWEIGSDSAGQTGDDPDIVYAYTCDFADFDKPGNSNRSGMYHYADLATSDPDAWLSAKHVMALALWYAYRKRDLSPNPAAFNSFISGTATAADVATYGDDPNLVRAMRFLAYAGMIMTKWYTLDSQPAQGTIPALPGLTRGVPIPGNEPGPGGIARPADLATLYASGTVDFIGNPSAQLPYFPDANELPVVTIDPLPSGVADPDFPTHPLVGHFPVTLTRIQNWHETSLALAMRFAANHPYDWRVLRPSNRAIMMDHPLIQYDMLSPAVSGIIAGTTSDPRIPGGPVAARQWRPVAARDDLIAGRNAAGDAVDWNALKGDIRHFSLTDTFAASERCRQIVCWTVDWQGYADSETAPSAPVDASRYPRMSPNITGDPYDSPGSFTGYYMGKLRGQYGYNPSVRFMDKLQPLSRNPEKFMAFVKPVDSWATGTEVRRWVMGLDLSDGNNGDQDALSVVGDDFDTWDTGGYLHPNYAATRSDPRAIFSGIYGADRNWNQRLDRGPIDPGIRLRAIEVGRFNVYDPRLALSLR